MIPPTNIVIGTACYYFDPCLSPSWETTSITRLHQLVNICRWQAKVSSPSGNYWSYHHHHTMQGLLEDPDVVVALTSK